jgi:hypothetical protein
VPAQRAQHQVGQQRRVAEAEVDHDQRHGHHQHDRHAQVAQDRREDAQRSQWIEIGEGALAADHHLGGEQPGHGEQHQQAQLAEIAQQLRVEPENGQQRDYQQHAAKDERLEKRVGIPLSPQFAELRQRLGFFSARNVACANYHLSLFDDGQHRRDCRPRLGAHLLGALDIDDAV